jgi:MFS family permease
VLSALFPHKRDQAILLPAVGAQLILGTSMSLLPVFIENLRTQTGLRARDAGYLLSSELAVAALITIFLSVWNHTHSVRKWALSGGVIAVLGTMLTLLSPAAANLVVSRLLAGAGAGLVGAEAMRMLSRGIDKQRLIATVTVASIVNAAFWFAVLPSLTSRFGYRAPYLCLLLVNLTGTALLTRLPSMPTKRSAQHASTRISMPVILVVAAIFLTQLGQGAFWSLEEIYGSNAGLNGDAVGMVLAFSTLLLIAGAAGAAWASDRFGRFTTFFILLTINALSILLVGTVKVHWVYIAANVLQALTNLSSLICQLGLSASLDRLGRAVAASTAMVTLGNGIGPGLPASLSAWLGMPAIAVVVLGLNGLAIGLFCIVILRWYGEERLSL